jgi:hypothetical protein
MTAEKGAVPIVCFTPFTGSIFLNDFNNLGYQMPFLHPFTGFTGRGSE